jgi:uncharacterized repeat protein (TIGR02543 family)
MKFTHSGKIGLKSRGVYMYIKESKTAVLKFFSAVVVFVLSFNSVSSIARADEPDTEIVSCSTSGWITIQDNVLVSNESCLGSVEIPLFVTEISAQAFLDVSGLTEVTFDPNSVLSSVGDRAFKGTGITEITIPASVTSIGSEAFADLADLVRVSFAADSQLEIIGTGAFKSTGITEVTIPDSTTSIGSEAFANISGLTLVILDSGSSETEAALATIGASAFIGSGLAAITIPASVTSIGDLAFANSESLEKVYFLGDAPLVGQDAFLLVSETAEGVVLWTANGFEAGENWNGLQIVIFGSTPCSNSGFVLTVDGEITNNYGCAGDLEIPSDVAAIGPGAFLGADLLETISYADESSLAVIQERAFANTGLTSVSLPATVVSIGDQAFANTAGLTSITFDPESTLTTIGFGAFSYSGLVEFTVPSTVTSIGDEAFGHTADLAAISFDIGSNETGSTLESIGSGAFNSSGLAEINIPASVTTIGDLVFANASALTVITFGSEETASNLATIGASAFSNSALTSIDLPASVTTIGDKAFAYTYDLTIFNFTPNSNLSSIGAGAFNYSGISEITIPASVTTIGDQAFGFTSELTSFNFATGSTLKTIGSNAFNYSGITEIKIPASITTISDQAFINQSELTSILFETGSHLATIGVSAFAGTGITEITIPASVTGISDQAFADTFDLTKFDFVTGSTLKTIGANVFSYSGITAITIPASVTTLSDQAFANTFDLITFNFATGSTLKTIGANTFSYSGITQITIPASVTTLSDQAFANTKYLKSFEVRSGSSSFASNSGVLFNAGQTILLLYPVGSEDPPDSNERIYTVPSSVVEIADGAFKGIYKNTEIVFPENSGLKKIGANAFNSAGITEINIPASVTTIGNQAFANAALLTSVTIGANSALKTIGEGAFTNTKIASFDVPSGVTTIGKGAFENVTTLQTFNLPAGSQLSTIGDYAFYNASLISAINIPATVTSIGEHAFANATSLAGVTIGANSALKTIGESAFENTNVASFDIPIGVTQIRNFTFSGTTSLTTITIPSSVTSIGNGAFQEASSLTTITIPSSVTSIGDGAFNSTTLLTKFYFLGNAPSGISNFENLAPNATAYKSAAATGFTGATWRGLKVQLGIFPVVFDSQGGSAVASQTMFFGIPLAVAPAPPTLAGFVFAGWSETQGGASITFPYTPSTYSSKTLYAKWIQQAKVGAVKPSVSGKVVSTKTGTNKLTVNPGTWTGVPAPTFTYQWYTCTVQIKAAAPTIPKTCTIIKGQTKNLLPVVIAYKGKFLAASVIGTSAGTPPTTYLTASSAKVT